MNKLSATELRRRGMTAIEEGLRRGPIQLIKRNSVTAVVLSTAEYQHLVATPDKNFPGMTALEWLLHVKKPGRRSKRVLDRELARERNWRSP